METNVVTITNVVTSISLGSFLNDPTLWACFEKGVFFGVQLLGFAMLVRLLNSIRRGGWWGD